MATKPGRRKCRGGGGGALKELKKGRQRDAGSVEAQALRGKDGGAGQVQSDIESRGQLQLKSDFAEGGGHANEHVRMKPLRLRGNFAAALDTNYSA